MLVHVKFYEFNDNIIIVWFATSANPQFNVVSCCSGQVLCKPWRVVKLTACAGGCTVVTIPEDVIRIEYKLTIPFRVQVALAEVVIFNKCRDIIVVRCITRTACIKPLSDHFTYSNSKGRNVLTSSHNSMSEANTQCDIVAVNSSTRESITSPKLVSPYPPTHTAVW